MKHSIKLQFVCEADPISAAICLFTQGHFSHVDAVLGDGPRAQLVGARSDHAGGKAPGFHLRPTNYLPFKRQVIFEIPCTEDQHHNFWAFTWNQIGKPYDYSVIWGFVTGRNWQETDSWVCSEEQAAALKACGLLPADLWVATNKIAPVMLSGMVSAIGAKATVIR